MQLIVYASAAFHLPQLHQLTGHFHIAEDLFFSICSPIERSVVAQLRRSCGSRAVPVYYWSLLAQGYATAPETDSGVADLLPLCTQLWSHPLFPSIFALLFHLWLLGQFSRVGSQRGFQSVQLAALASGCQRLFWSDVQTHSVEFRSIFSFLCGATTDRERMQSVAPQLHRELAFVVMRFALYYTSGDPAVGIIKQLPARGVLTSKAEAAEANIPWEYTDAITEAGWQSSGSDSDEERNGQQAHTHHVAQQSAPSLLQSEHELTSGILRSGRFPKTSSTEHTPLTPPQAGQADNGALSVPADMHFAPASPASPSMRQPPSLSSLTAEQPDTHLADLQTPPRSAKPVEGGSPESTDTPYMFDSDSDSSTSPVSPNRFVQTAQPASASTAAAIDGGVLLAGHPPLPDFSQPLGGGFSPALTAPASSSAADYANDTADDAKQQAASVTGGVTSPSTTAASSHFLRNPAAQTIASEARRVVAEEPQLQFNEGGAGGLHRTPSMAGISQEALEAAAAADAAQSSRVSSESSAEGHGGGGVASEGGGQHAIGAGSGHDAQAPYGELSAAVTASPLGAMADNDSVVSAPGAMRPVQWGQPRWDVSPGDPRAMGVKLAAFVLQATSTVRGIRHEASLVHYLSAMACFADGELQDSLSGASAARLRACLHAFTSPGGPLFPTKRVRAVSRRTLDAVFPSGVTVRRLVALSFRLLSPTYVLESAQQAMWTTTVSCAGRLGCSPRQVTSSAVGLLKSLGLPLPAPVTASLRALPSRAEDASQPPAPPVHAMVAQASKQAQMCCSRVLCVCCCVPTRFTMPADDEAVRSL